MTRPAYMDSPKLLPTFLLACGFMVIGTAALAVAPYWEDFTPQANDVSQASALDDADAGRVWIVDPPSHVSGLDGEFGLYGDYEVGGLLGGIKGEEIGLGGKMSRKVPGVSSDATEPIPEPSTFWLLGSGLLLLGGRIKRKLF